MNAKIENGIAVLEEFLQEKYVENFENLSERENKVERAYDYRRLFEFFIYSS